MHTSEYLLWEESLPGRSSEHDVTVATYQDIKCAETVEFRDVKCHCVQSLESWAPDPAKCTEILVVSLVLWID